MSLLHGVESNSLVGHILNVTTDCGTRERKQDKILREAKPSAFLKITGKQTKKLLASNDYMNSFYNFQFCDYVSVTKLRQGGMGHTPGSTTSQCHP